MNNLRKDEKQNDLIWDFYMFQVERQQEKAEIEEYETE